MHIRHAGEGTYVRVLIQKMTKGSKSLQGKNIHVEDTTFNEVYNIVLKALKRAEKNHDKNNTK